MPFRLQHVGDKQKFRQVQIEKIIVFFQKSFFLEQACYKLFRILINNYQILNNQMRRIFNLFAKNLPFLTRKVAFFSLLYAQHHFIRIQNQIHCASSPQTLRRNIENIEQKSIKIYQNGRFVGYAYCFTMNYLVTTCQQLLEKGNNNKKYEYYLNGEKLKGSFKPIGNFENLVFIQCTLAEKVSSLLGDFKQPSSYSEIQIIKPKQFISLKRGFFIKEDSGYGIIDGQGEVGSLITNQQGISGIVVQIGTQSLKGFMRMIQWRYLMPILQHVKGRPLHLGISAQALQNHEGVSIVRIAPNSPFKHEIMMGDIILRANGHSFRDPQSFKRICIESEGEINLVIQRDGKQVQAKVHL